MRWSGMPTGPTSPCAASGWTPRAAEAAELLATVTGQDIEETSDGRFRILEGTTPDRVISTVDPEARHGHKTAAHGVDGDKAHVAVDPTPR